MLKISPVSVKNNICFCGRKEVQKPKFESLRHSDKTLQREKDFSFLTGALCAATILCGVNHVEKEDRNFMLHTIEVESNSVTPQSKIIVSDKTGDGVPDIIIEDEFGEQSIYDVSNSSFYFKDDLGLEKLY